MTEQMVGMRLSATLPAFLEPGGVNVQIESPDGSDSVALSGEEEEHGLRSDSDNGDDHASQASSDFSIPAQQEDQWGADHRGGWTSCSGDALIGSQLQAGLFQHVEAAEVDSAESEPDYGGDITYVAYNGLLHTKEDGIAFRCSRSLADICGDKNNKLQWGRSVRGVVEDGWLQVADGRFLPLTLNGLPVLVSAHWDTTSVAQAAKSRRAQGDAARGRQLSFRKIRVLLAKRFGTKRPQAADRQRKTVQPATRRSALCPLWPPTTH